jgi:hypothetical protein
MLAVQSTITHFTNHALQAITKRIICHEYINLNLSGITGLHLAGRHCCRCAGSVFLKMFTTNMFPIRTVRFVKQAPQNWCLGRSIDV